MIQGLNAFYSNAWYIVIDDRIYRYDGVCVDKLVSYGSVRGEKDFKLLQERMEKAKAIRNIIMDKRLGTSVRSAKEITQYKHLKTSQEYRAYRRDEIMGYFRMDRGA